MPLRVLLKSGFIAALCVGFLVFVGVNVLAGSGSWWTRSLLITSGVLLIGAGTCILWALVPQWDPLLATLKKNCHEKTVAFTFDDGPAEPWTSQILDVLKDSNISATFFLIGERANQYPALVRRMLAEGHAIGNHTLSHRRLLFSPTVRVAAEIDACSAILYRIAGMTSTLFRAPHGARHFRLPKILAARSLTHIPWTRGIWDTDQPPSSLLIRRATRRARALEIILLHDGPGDDPRDSRSPTVAALPAIIRAYRERAYRFVTIPQLLEAHR